MSGGDRVPDADVVQAARSLLDEIGKGAGASLRPDVAERVRLVSEAVLRCLPPPEAADVLVDDPSTDWTLDPETKARIEEIDRFAATSAHRARDVVFGGTDDATPFVTGYAPPSDLADLALRMRAHSIFLGPDWHGPDGEALQHRWCDDADELIQQAADVIEALETLRRNDCSLVCNLHPRDDGMPGPNYMVVRNEIDSPRECRISWGATPVDALGIAGFLESVPFDEDRRKASCGRFASMPIADETVPRWSARDLS